MYQRQDAPAIRVRDEIQLGRDHAGDTLAYPVEIDRHTSAAVSRQGISNQRL
jgi:hypothetical protein